MNNTCALIRTLHTNKKSILPAGHHLQLYAILLVIVLLCSYLNVHLNVYVCVWASAGVCVCVCVCVCVETHFTSQIQFTLETLVVLVSKSVGSPSSLDFSPDCDLPYIVIVNSKLVIQSEYIYRQWDFETSTTILFRPAFLFKKKENFTTSKLN